jgi:hypothetical protein
MMRFGPRHWLFAAVLAVFVLGAVVPAYAGYDKFYRFKNTTGSTQTSLRAILMGMEVIGAQYTDDGTFNPWGEGTAGLQNVGGVYCSTIQWSEADSLSTAMKVGWNTTDHSCQLRDLRWGSGDVITPNIDSSNVPGGGVLTHEGGYYYWTITNDTGTTILLGRPEGSTVEVGSFTVPLDLDSGDLGQLADQGIAGHVILLLQAKVYDASTQDPPLIPDPGATSLLKKLLKAQDALNLALRALENGDMATFYYQRDAAVKAMETFVSELWRNNKIPPDFRNELAAEGDAVVTRLYTLPEGDMPDDYGVTGPGGTDEVPHVLGPGESFTVSIPDTDVTVGDSLVMHGAVVNPVTGIINVDWVDQALIKADLISPTLTVVGSGEVDSLDEPGAWYNEEITVGFEASDVGDDWKVASGVAGLIVIEDDVQLPYVEADTWTKTYTSGMHTIAAVAIDYAGNLSEQKFIKVGVDQQAPVIVWDDPPTTPDRLWSPDHTMRLVHLNYTVIEDNDYTVEVAAVSSEPDEGTGDGDYPNDIQYLFNPDGTQDAWNLLLRSERSGGGDGRCYTISVTATDVAGNSTTSAVGIWVSHDQGSKVVG